MEFVSWLVTHMGHKENKMELTPELLLMPGTPPESLTQYPALFPAQIGRERLC
jgi:hypothetical protein